MEGAAAAGGAVEFDPAAHLFREAAGDGQSEARSVMAPGGGGAVILCLFEGLEDPLVQSGGDARPVVGDGDAQLPEAVRRGG